MNYPVSTKTNKRTNNVYHVKGQFHKRAEALRRQHYNIDEALTFPLPTQQSQIFIDAKTESFIVTDQGGLL